MFFPRHQDKTYAFGTLFDTDDFEPHDTFVENLPALSANALGLYSHRIGFVMGHQALPLWHVQISLLQGSGLKFYILMQMEQKSIEKSSKKKSANLPTPNSPDLRETRRPRWISANPVVCRVSFVETRLPHWHATSARFIEVAQVSIFSDSAWISMDIGQEHIKTHGFLHFIVLVSKFCPRSNWKNTGHVSSIPWKDWVITKERHVRT